MAIRAALNLAQRHDLYRMVVVSNSGRDGALLNLSPRHQPQIDL